MDKKLLKEKETKIIELVKGFCDNDLNQEYFELSVKLIQKLGRKRNPPFETGKLEIWAAAVIHALGTINFLFDKASKPYSTVDILNNYFGTNKSTTTGKSKEIRDTLKLTMFDSAFSTSSAKERNPFNNLMMVNGFIVSTKYL
jgi:hypothetical protein